ncbi:hypothetical protein RUM44_001892 [Polyplax serrata]|uniref:Uncharacterized protein n=1 Tax=Polyplax serrata TaxID=468196 RepID=A0ABR1ALC9_POLSC
METGQTPKSPSEPQGSITHPQEKTTDTDKHRHITHTTKPSHLSETRNVGRDIGRVHLRPCTSSQITPSGEKRPKDDGKWNALGGTFSISDTMATSSAFDIGSLLSPIDPL